MIDQRIVFGVLHLHRNHCGGRKGGESDGIRERRTLLWCKMDWICFYSMDIVEVLLRHCLELYGGILIGFITR